MSNEFDFEILIDESFLTLNPECSLAPAENKNVLTILNDFEDEKWRYNKFQNFIWDNIAETALSQNDTASARNELIELLGFHHGVDRQFCPDNQTLRARYRGKIAGHPCRYAPPF